jgi:hypothetical protein
MTDIHVILASHEVGGLRIRKGCATVGWATRRIWNGYRRACIFSSFGRAMKVSGGGGSAKSGIGQLPGQHFRRCVVVEIGVSR